MLVVKLCVMRSGVGSAWLWSQQQCAAGMHMAFPRGCTSVHPCVVTAEIRQVFSGDSSLAAHTVGVGRVSVWTCKRQRRWFRWKGGGEVFAGSAGAVPLCGVLLVSTEEEVMEGWELGIFWEITPMGRL